MKDITIINGNIYIENMNLANLERIKNLYLSFRERNIGFYTLEKDLIHINKLIRKRKIESFNLENFD